MPLVDSAPSPSPKVLIHPEPILDQLRRPATLRPCPALSLPHHLLRVDAQHQRRQNQISAAPSTCPCPQALPAARGAYAATSDSSPGPTAAIETARAQAQAFLVHGPLPIPSHRQHVVSTHRPTLPCPHPIPHASERPRSRRPGSQSHSPSTPVALSNGDSLPEREDAVIVPCTAPMHALAALGW